jgi:hypothetical protein
MTENKTNRIREKRIESLKKANQVKYSEYPTTIHALQEKIHARLDQYLNYGFPTMVCLRKLCTEFPFVRLPSYKAVQNYRKKYHVLGCKYQETIEAQNVRLNSHLSRFDGLSAKWK